MTMGKVSKGLCLLFVVMLVSVSLLAIQRVCAQSNPDSPVPDFTLKLIDHSYDVPERMATTIDPYTGKPYNFTLPGYHQENKTIEITIKNPSGADYYNFRWKEHSENEWNYEPFNPANPYSLDYMKYVPYNASMSTIIKEIPYNASTSTFTSFTLYFIKVNAIPTGREMDVQVQALYGNFKAGPSEYQPALGGVWYDLYFNGTTSDWSNTQTLTIPAANNSPSPSPTVPELSLLSLLPLSLILASVALVLKRRKK